MKLEMRYSRHFTLLKTCLKKTGEGLTPGMILEYTRKDSIQ